LQPPIDESEAVQRSSDEILLETFQKVLKVLERSQYDLKDSEARYRAIVESQSELICRFLPDGTLTFVNEAYCEYFNAPREKLLNQNFLPLLSDEERAVTLASIAAKNPDNSTSTIEHVYALENGKTRWINWTNRGIYDGGGRLIEIQSVGRDITASKRTEIAAEQHTRELRALHNATTALITTLDLEALLSRILDAAISAIPAGEKGRLHLIALDTGQLEMRASIGYSDPRIQKITVPGSEGYITKSVRTGRPILLDDLRANQYSEPEAKMPEANEIRSAIVAPLILNDQVLGALSLESSQTTAFANADLDLLASFAATASAAIRNAQLHAKVQKLAITDALTGLYNRRGFFELGPREIERALRFGRPLTAIMLDIDHFKVVNDTYGHSVGDQVLSNVATLCSSNIRKVDILGRYGGDEFSLLLPETDTFTANSVAERLRAIIEESGVMVDASLVKVTISLGVTRATADIEDLEALLRRADKALYAAKQGGRNRVVTG
jgi:diguanylate cyclase (GGDEF)-like protein/PAS domain S-box-containing protein